MTGPRPNPLAGLADDAVCIAAADTAAVQEVHLVTVHLICEAFDEALELTSVPQLHMVPNGSDERAVGEAARRPR
jgi:hypothetical protein